MDYLNLWNKVFFCINICLFLNYLDKVVVCIILLSSMQYHLLCVAIDAPPDTEQSAPFQDEGGRVKSELLAIVNIQWKLQYNAYGQSIY